MKQKSASTFQLLRALALLFLIFTISVSASCGGGGGSSDSGGGSSGGGSSTTWASVSAGSYHTVAIKTDGTLWAWGRNNYGQLGDGTVVDKNTPTNIP